MTAAPPIQWMHEGPAAHAHMLSMACTRGHAQNLICTRWIYLSSERTSASVANINNLAWYDGNTRQGAEEQDNHR